MSPRNTRPQDRVDLIESLFNRHGFWLCRHFYPQGKEKDGGWWIGGYKGEPGELIRINMADGIWIDTSLSKCPGLSFPHLLMATLECNKPAAEREIARALNIDLGVRSRKEQRPTEPTKYESEAKRTELHALRPEEHPERLGQDDNQEPEAFAHVVPYPVINPKAYYGPLGRITQILAPATEADPAAVLVQLLVGWGNVFGRGAYFSVSSTKHFTNLFCCIVGRTAKARKGLALGVAQWILDRVDADWVRDNIRSGLASGEGLIWKVRDPIYSHERNRKSGVVDEVLTDPGVEDKRLLVAETEFGNALTVMGRSGNTLSAVIRDAFDGKERLGSLVKNSPYVASGAHISIIEQITAHELRLRMKECEHWDGFANRFFFACARRAQVMSDPPDLSQVEGLGEELSELIERTCWAKKVCEMERDEKAKRLWDKIYNEFADDDTEDVVAATIDRGDVLMLRLSMIYALSDGSRIIKAEHVEDRARPVAIWFGERPLPVWRSPGQFQGRKDLRLSAPPCSGRSNAKGDQRPGL
jgi:hypothetical protein